MKKKIKAAIIGFVAAGLAPALITAEAAAQERLKASKTEESLFLDLHRTGLGQLGEIEEKRRFLGSVQAEKQRIEKQMLRNIYDNAFEHYRHGNYEEAKLLSEKILSIDPTFADASMLLEATNQLRDGKRVVMSEKLMIEDRFKSSLSLYRQGRLEESLKKMEEVSKLSPNNIKARYWVGRIEDDLKNSYVEKGEKAYKAGDLKGALDTLYEALMLRPNDPAVVQRITRIEDELRRRRANERLKIALGLYAKGKLTDSVSALQRVLEVQPGDPKTLRLLAEVKNELAQNYINKGRSLYSSRRYTDAIAQWERARPYSSNTAYLDKLSERARQQMKREEDARERRAQEAARRAREAAEEEARRAREEQERLKASREAKDEKPSGVVTEQNRLVSQQRYLEGLKYFQNANYSRARDEWTIAKQLDPGNTDAVAGLKRIELILSGGQ